MFEVVEKEEPEANVIALACTSELMAVAVPVCAEAPAPAAAET